LLASRYFAYIVIGLTVALFAYHTAWHFF
jgi:hypothetical protein